jgi:hypothetical protein
LEDNDHCYIANLPFESLVRNFRISPKGIFEHHVNARIVIDLELDRKRFCSNLSKTPNPDSIAISFELLMKKDRGEDSKRIHGNSHR